MIWRSHQTATWTHREKIMNCASHEKTPDSSSVSQQSTYTRSTILKKAGSVFQYMVVSLNGGTPKSSIVIGVSIINHPFWGTTILGNPHISISHPICFKTLFVSTPKKIHPSAHTTSKVPLRDPGRLPKVHNQVSQAFPTRGLLVMRESRWLPG